MTHEFQGCESALNQNLLTSAYRVNSRFGGTTRTLRYEELGRLASESLALPGLETAVQFSYRYDGNGNLGEIDYPPQSMGGSPMVLSLPRGPDGQISAVDFFGTRLARDVVHFPFGDLRSFVRGNNITTLYERDSFSGSRTLVQSSPISLSYAVDALGQPSSVAETGDIPRTRVWTYDPEGQLTSATASDVAGALVYKEQYTYDKAGNRLVRLKNGVKLYTSFFDMGDAGLPANDLLRRIVDPYVDGGVCVVPGAKDAGPHPLPAPDAGCHDNGWGHGDETHNHCHDSEKEGDDDGASGSSSPPPIVADAGTLVLPATCPAPRSPTDTAALVRDWRRLVEQAEKVVSQIPAMTRGQLRQASTGLMNDMKAWMSRYGITPQGLVLVVMATHDEEHNFGSLLTPFLQRRADLPNTFEAEDLRLLHGMLELLEHADVRSAGEMDPIWSYGYDGAGRVIEERLSVPAQQLNGQSFGPLEVTYCYRYDGLRALTRIDMLSRSGAQVTSATVPACADKSRSVVAQYAYDDLARRVWSQVAGVSTWFGYSPAGELLAEVSQAGDVERAYVYLESEPLAQVVRTAGYANRPDPPVAALGCSSTADTSTWHWPLAAAALVLMARRRRLATSAILVAAVFGLFSCLGSNDNAAVYDAGPNAGASTRPTGTLSGDPVYYYHNDRLGTPQRLTDEAGKTVWTAEYLPFGGLQSLDTDPDKNGVHVENNLRFPGQYDDGLTAALLGGGPIYNWHRNYEAASGRYLQLEPMIQSASYSYSLLKNGMFVASFSYALGNPVDHTDPDGLDGSNPWDWPQRHESPPTKYQFDPGGKCAARCEKELKKQEEQCLKNKHYVLNCAGIAAQNRIRCMNACTSPSRIPQEKPELSCR